MELTSCESMAINYNTDTEVNRTRPIFRTNAILSFNVLSLMPNSTMRMVALPSSRNKRVLADVACYCKRAGEQFARVSVGMLSLQALRVASLRAFGNPFGCLKKHSQLFPE